ncbi:unnamed protein product [Ostreobium quekettii]|uniref:Uncharacterized protein n=1 Tax=Ostreobium quekettii TaxID=121088 RepID=A0A8S1IYB4_9CHLO|nr:unnamed protein product [Ostreobium quekettii]
MTLTWRWLVKHKVDRAFCVSRLLQTYHSVGTHSEVPAIAIVVQMHGHCRALRANVTQIGQTHGGIWIVTLSHSTAEGEIPSMREVWNAAGPIVKGHVAVLCPCVWDSIKAGMSVGGSGDGAGSWNACTWLLLEGLKSSRI